MPCDDRLVEITPERHQVVIDLAYARADNLTGKSIYAGNRCLLHRAAEPGLLRAAAMAALCGLRLKVLDAYRPQQAQERLWRCLPDPEYVAEAGRGSNHTRGVALDVTLVDPQGEELDMGTGFDAMAEPAHHLASGLPPAASRNRFVLVGIMAMAGFRALESEWWHYELPGARSFPLLQDDRIACCAP
jgi:D-alanyl-D-alanine dipeptidase